MKILGLILIFCAVILSFIAGRITKQIEITNRAIYLIKKPDLSSREMEIIEIMSFGETKNKK